MGEAVKDSVVSADNLRLAQDNANRQKPDSCMDAHGGACGVCLAPNIVGVVYCI